MATSQKIINVPFNLFPKQHEFHVSTKTHRGYVGGLGSGKTTIGAMDLICRAKPGRFYAVITPTYTMLETSTMRKFKEVAWELKMVNVNSFKKSPPPSVKLNNGAEVIFLSGDHPEHLRGPNLSGVWLDEAGLIEEEVFDIIIGRLREAGEQGWLSATFTPKGKQHWTYTRFGLPQPDTQLFHSKTSDNPFLPKGFADRLKLQYTSNFGAQELEGLFMDVEGAMFKRHWFEVIDQMPSDIERELRVWDLAATAKEEGKDPDWSAGPKLSLTKNGLIIISDIRRLQGTPLQVEHEVKTTAERDGKSIPIWMEQEPGASGKTVIDHYIREVLRGYNFKGERSTGKKHERARPLAAYAERGLVKILRGHYVNEFLDEASSFPFGKHDDQIDAVASGFDKICQKPIDIYAILDALATGAKGDISTKEKDALPTDDKGAVIYDRQTEEYLLYLHNERFNNNRQFIFGSTDENEALYAAQLLGIGDGPKLPPDLSQEERDKINQRREHIRSTLAAKGLIESTALATV